MTALNMMIFFASISTTTVIGCPSPCNCTENSVLCIEKNLTSIPSFLSVSNAPLVLDLSGNDLVIIGNNQFKFQDSEDVKEIYLNNSRIVQIEADAFEDVENLQNLYLGQNLLTSIPEDLIIDHTDMILLDLSSNYFQTGFPKIRSRSLEVLALANSKITKVPHKILDHLPNLRVLFLQQNSIHYMSPVVFHNLEYFYLVNITYNAWKCNCRTIDLFDFLFINNYIDTSQPLHCFSASQKYINVHEKNTLEYFTKKCSTILDGTIVLEESNKNQTQQSSQVMVKELNGKSSTVERSLHIGEDLKATSNDTQLHYAKNSKENDGQDVYLSKNVTENLKKVNNSSKEGKHEQNILKNQTTEIVESIVPVEKVASFKENFILVNFTDPFRHSSNNNSFIISFGCIFLVAMGICILVAYLLTKPYSVNRRFENTESQTKLVYSPTEVEDN